MKLGKLPARKDAVKRKFSEYLTATLPTPPAKYGHEKLVTNWQMLGNDQYGDCVLAGADNETMVWTAEGSTQAEFTAQNALDDYSAITGFNPRDPNTDQGTDMQVAASYRLKTGVIDHTGTRHKVGAYVALKPGDKEELKLAMYLFGAVGVGIEFPASAMDQFNGGKPWTVKRGSQIEGGHYIPAIAYDSTYIHIVTWGKVQKMTWAFYKKYCDEVVAYLSPEFLKGGKTLEGFNLVQLTTDLNNITKGA